MNYYIKGCVKLCPTVRVWLVALARTKLVKKNKPLGKSTRIFRVSENQAMNYTYCCT